MLSRLRFAAVPTVVNLDFERLIAGMIVTFAVVAYTMPVSAITVTHTSLANVTTTLFEDGFEGGTIGQTLQPYAVTGKWNVIINGPTSTLTPQGVGGPGPGAPAVGNHYLSFFRSTEPPGSDVIANGMFTTPVDTGTIHASWYAYIPELDNKDYGMLVGMSDAGYTATFTRMALLTVNSSNANVGYRHQTGSTNAYDFSPDIQYKYDTWQHWQVDWTLGSGQMTLKIGDGAEQVSAVLNIPDTPGNPLDHFFVVGGNFNYHYYLDGDSLATPPAWIPGDFDIDGDVDGADFVIWQTNFPRATNGRVSRGDADYDRDVDGADFVAWQTAFPYPPPSPGTSPVPEPGAWILALVGLIGLRGLQRTQGRA